MLVRALMLSLAALLACAPAVRAFHCPSFDCDWNAWEATDVVVVSEGEALDGKVRVQEVWRGECVVGATLDLPGLAQVSLRAARTFTEDPRVEVPVTTRVSCQRMLLYLRRDREGWKAARDFGGFEVSTAWLEPTGAFGWVQTMNPGPVELISIDSEQTLRSRVHALGAVRDGLTRALAQADLAQRARALRRLLGEPLVSSAVYAAMSDCGPVALPVFVELLRDRARWIDSQYLVKAASAACGPVILPDLLALLEDEAIFWEAEGPRLVPGWRDLTWDHPLGARSWFAYQLLLSLEASPDVRCRRVVARFRRPWHDLPALNDPRNEHLLQACDGVLAACDRLERSPR